MAHKLILSRPEDGGVQAAGPDPAYLPGPDQAARFQHLDKLKDSGQRHVQRLGQLGDTPCCQRP